MDKIELTLSQHYEMEKLSREIDQINDPKQLRQLCKSLLRVWMIQKAATLWMMRQESIK